MGKHGHSSCAGGLGEVARFEQPPVESGQELLGSADVERPGHRDDRADAGLDQRGCDGSESALCVLIDCARLAGVQNDHRDAELMERGAERLSRDRVGFALGGLEHEAALGSLECVRIHCLAERGRLVGVLGDDAVAAVAVEMEDVIVAGPAGELLAKGVERRRAEDRDAGGQAVLLDLLDQGAGDGAVLHVGLEGPGRDEQDIEPVVWEALGQGRRVRHVVELPLDVAFLGEITTLGVVQGLPGPGQDGRLIGDDSQLQVLGAVPDDVAVPVAGHAAMEEGLEGVRAPGFEDSRSHGRPGPCSAGRGTPGIAPDTSGVPAAGPCPGSSLAANRSGGVMPVETGVVWRDRGEPP